MPNHCKTYFECHMENFRECDYYMQNMELQDCIYMDETECTNKSAQMDSINHTVDNIINYMMQE